MAKSPFPLSGNNSPTCQLFANTSTIFNKIPKNNVQPSSNSKSTMGYDTNLDKHMQQSVNTLLHMKGSPTTKDSRIV